MKDSDVTRHDPSPEKLRPRDPVILRLLAMLEQASVGSRELDEEIYFFLYKSLLPVGYPLDTLGNYRYSSSLDAALQLVPPDLYWRVTNFDEHADGALAEIMNADRPGACRGAGATPALALCIAALKARTQS